MTKKLLPRIAHRLGPYLPRIPKLPSVRKSVAWLRARPRRMVRLRWCAVVLALLLVAAVLAPPVSRKIKGWQSRRLAKAASVLLENGDPVQAEKKLRDALALRPDQPEVATGV